MNSSGESINIIRKGSKDDKDESLTEAPNHVDSNSQETAKHSIRNSDINKESKKLKEIVQAKQNLLNINTGSSIQMVDRKNSRTSQGSQTYGRRNTKTQ